MELNATGLDVPLPISSGILNLHGWKATALTERKDSYVICRIAKRTGAFVISTMTLPRTYVLQNSSKTRDTKCLRSVTLACILLQYFRNSIQEVSRVNQKNT